MPDMATSLPSISIATTSRTLCSGKSSLPDHELEINEHSPPPTEAIWRKNIKFFSQRDSRKYPITVTLMGRERMVQSPINFRVKYPECMVCSLFTSQT